MSVFAKWAELPHHHVVKLRRGNEGTHYLSALDLKDFSEISQQSLDLTFLNPKNEYTASSCGGLLLFTESGSDNFFLCNPTTKQFRSFPNDSNSSWFLIGALGYNYKLDDYRMVRLFGRHKDSKLYAEVYSLKRDNVWREIDSAPRYSPTTRHSIYVAASGKSYWLAAAGADDVERVVSFDFCTEKFSDFELPTLPYIFCPAQHVLVKLHDGLLGVVRYWVRGMDRRFANPPGYYYELWVLEEEEGMWNRMFDVCLCGGAGKPLGLLDGRFLFLEGESDSRDAKQVLLVYDWITKRCVDKDPRIHIFDYCYTPVLSYVEGTDVLLPQGITIQPQPPSQPKPIPPMSRRPRLLRKIYGLDDRCCGDASPHQYYEYEYIENEVYKDWLQNGFRVDDEYHPSKVRYVFELDYETDVYIDIRERRDTLLECRNGGEDVDSKDDDIPYIYSDQLVEKINGDSQGKQLAEDVRKRKRDPENSGND